MDDPDVDRVSGMREGRRWKMMKVTGEREKKKNKSEE